MHVFELGWRAMGMDIQQGFDEMTKQVVFVLSLLNGLFDMSSNIFSSHVYQISFALFSCSFPLLPSFLIMSCCKSFVLIFPPLPSFSDDPCTVAIPYNTRSFFSGFKNPACVRLKGLFS